MEKQLVDLKKAQIEYALFEKSDITEKLLQYILTRIEANKDEIEKLQKIRNERYSYERIIDCVRKELEEDIRYKDYGKMYINQAHFLNTTLLMPVGVIAVEAYDTLEVIKYFIRAIKSRNAIVISDIEYDDTSIKFLILEIIKEALTKFGIDKNLIMILPYEECYYDYFDRVIFTYDKYGKFLSKLKIQEKESPNKYIYIYIENSMFEGIVKKDNENYKYEIVTGDFETAIEKINKEKCKAAVIYTANGELAYKFINMVKGENVFVNSSLENVIEVPKSENVLYQYKNIIIPIPQEVTRNGKEKNVVYKNEEKSLVKVNTGILDKIKMWLKNIFC
jgi:hypothetical protein